MKEEKEDIDNVIEGEFVEQEPSEVVENVPEPETIKLVPKIQSCLMTTKHGRKTECKFWVHTEKYFQYYEPGYTLRENEQGQYLIEGNMVVVPDHEIQYMIIRYAQTAVPEAMFLALGGKKKLIIDLGQPSIVGVKPIKL